MIDYVLDFMKKNNLPMDRETYVEINWMGVYDPRKPLPAELESEIPEEFQLKSEKGEDNG